LRKVVTAEDWMMEVIKDCPAINKFAGSAQMIEARAYVGVLPEAPTFVLLVPAVNFQKIFFPHTHVAADDSSLGRVSFDNGERESNCFGGAGELTRKKETKTWNGLAHLEGGRGRGIKIRAATLNPESLFGETSMILDEFGVGNTVRIGEDKVVAFRSSQGLVEDGILSKASVFVPEVMDWTG
jgi:hypothetical protein